ncbi:MAG: hypothetical protein WBD22_07690 [Pyrinomonadaceae bacterium]
MLVLLAGACGRNVDSQGNSAEAQPTIPIAAAQSPKSTPESAVPQTVITNPQNSKTASPIGNFDFKNFSYPLPRGWQHADGSDLALVAGNVKPVSGHISEDMSPEEQGARLAERRIGMSYVTTKYLDLTGDGDDEAFVILKVETQGSAVPQLVYIFTLKDGEPILLQHFRTGDRADGGLRDISMVDAQLVIELYGQDRFVLGETETGKITGDEEQLCCPTYFTRSRYKWNGVELILAGKRLTFETANPLGTPQENLGEIVNEKGVKKKKG